MNQKQFAELVQRTINDTSRLLVLKGAEYASDVDRLQNFKRNAERTGLSPLQVWAVYFFKHIDALESFIKRLEDFQCDNFQDYQVAIDRMNLSEPIEGRFYDAINYLFLGLALLEELQNPPPAEKEDETPL